MMTSSGSSRFFSARLYVVAADTGVESPPRPASPQAAPSGGSSSPSSACWRAYSAAVMSGCRAGGDATVDTVAAAAAAAVADPGGGTSGVPATIFMAATVLLGFFPSRSASCWMSCRSRSSICRPFNNGFSMMGVNAPDDRVRNDMGSSVPAPNTVAHPSPPSAPALAVGKVEPPSRSSPGTDAASSASRANSFRSKFFCSRNSPLNGATAIGCMTGARPDFRVLLCVNL